MNFFKFGKQLQSLGGEEGLEKNPISQKNIEKWLKKAEERMKSNPKLETAYEGYLKDKGEEFAKKFKIALGRFDYAKWSPEQNDFVDAATYTESVNA